METIGLFRTRVARDGAVEVWAKGWRLESQVPVLVPAVIAAGFLFAPFSLSVRALGAALLLACSWIVLRMTRLGFRKYFEAIVNAVDVTQGKPHPEIYQTAAARVGAEPTRCLVVEDALPGVEAGKAAGATCLGLMTSEGEAALRRAGADLVAPHFEALPPSLIPARS